mmetsp:Transcript_5399/g.12625  ORF Transcript_5399/g.12625 Transcript_5399/m.12625 type:complete len:205 (+) Transcript_5399:57-671(+)
MHIYIYISVLKSSRSWCWCCSSVFLDMRRDGIVHDVWLVGWLVGLFVCSSLERCSDLLVSFSLASSPRAKAVRAVPYFTAVRTVPYRRHGITPWRRVVVAAPREEFSAPPFCGQCPTGRRSQIRRHRPIDQNTSPSSSIGGRAPMPGIDRRVGRSCSCSWCWCWCCCCWCSSLCWNLYRWASCRCRGPCRSTASINRRMRIRCR